ncbi:PLAC8 family protein [Thraustotheca clavata]|uniref:PLAC8 family protein n=1 Tax=Thraustotheca clavata TaxID=74557 RepID=A0A1W0A2S1_9STRA|nr:PLAC8 family protein [Thraustotheca clavata]
MSDPVKLEARIPQHEPVAHDAHGPQSVGALGPQQVNPPQPAQYSNPQANVPPGQVPYYSPEQIVLAPQQMQYTVPQQINGSPQPMQYVTVLPGQTTPSPQVVYVTVQTPNNTNNTNNGFVTGRWKTGICDCFQDCIPNFWMAWCCPCVSYAQTSYRMNGSYCCAMLSYILFCAMPMICLRGNVRARYSIPGNCCWDCCCTCFCTICTLTQLAAHTESYTPGTCSFGTKDILPAYNQA